MDSIHHKICRRCGVDKSIDEFGPYPHSKDGHFHKCRICIKYRRLPTSEYIERVSAGLAYCFTCKSWKKHNEFVKSTSRLGGLSSRCILCHRVIANDCARRHSKEYAVSGNRWRKNNRDKHLESRKIWRAKNVFKERARFNEWASRNLDKCSANANRRRARKTAAGGTYTPEQFKDLCSKYDNRCLRCWEHKKLTVDHVIPIALGGVNSIENIQPLCKSCNSSKHTKTTDYRPLRDASIELPA